MLAAHLVGEGSRRSCRGTAPSRDRASAMPCARSASPTISGSVRPGNSTAANAPATPNSSCERAIERALPGAARDHQRAVDIEQDQPRLRQAASPLTLPARGPFADGSSSKLTRSPSLRLIEGAILHGAAVEEPLLAIVVADEPESPVAHQPFDRSVRHRLALRSRRAARGPLPLSISVPCGTPASPPLSAALQARPFTPATVTARYKIGGS